VVGVGQLDALNQTFLVRLVEVFVHEDVGWLRVQEPLGRN
jgi:hypothetical protein